MQKRVLIDAKELITVRVRRPGGDVIELEARSTEELFVRFTQHHELNFSRQEAQQLQHLCSALSWLQDPECQLRVEFILPAEDR